MFNEHEVVFHGEEDKQKTICYGVSDFDFGMATK